MPFINKIIKHKVIAITGLEKNTGKTECLNYILNRLSEKKIKTAVTSIGIDGEKADLVYKNEKPEIEIYKDFIFSTSESHYKQRKIISEILNVSERKTALGKLVTAKAINQGKIILSGPSSNLWISEWSDFVLKNHADIVLIDGAFSRRSHASPAISDAMVLNTGANVSTNLNVLISKTHFAVSLINIEKFCHPLTKNLAEKDAGVWSVSEDEVRNLNIPSILMIDKYKNDFFKHGETVYVAGIVTDKLLDFIRVQKMSDTATLIVKDFSKLFISPNSYKSFLSSGAKLKVLFKPNLLAVCVNPVANNGFVFPAKELCQKLSEKLNFPVYDIMSY